MNKTDFVHLLAKKSGMKIYQAEKALNAFVDAVTEVLAAGDEVKLVGFGIFSMKHREEFENYDPRIKEMITIPATNMPKFTPGKILKKALNEC
jgi:DNA-binding protein HU-beta